MPDEISITTEHGILYIRPLTSPHADGFVAYTKPLPEIPFLRIHSSCVFSESLNAIDCDCARQLNASLKHIREHGGILIYLYQEGRGIGLSGKIRAIRLEQETGCDTAESFRRLGYEPDPRTYEAAILELKNRGISKIHLSTSNPKKVSALEAAGINVVSRISLEIEKNDLIRKYLVEKTKALGLHEDN